MIKFRIGNKTYTIDRYNNTYRLAILTPDSIQVKHFNHYAKAIDYAFTNTPKRTERSK